LADAPNVALDFVADAGRERSFPPLTSASVKLKVGLAAARRAQEQTS